MSELPEIWRERSPLMTEGGWDFLESVRQDASAPRWNFETGDRTTVEDVERVKAFRKAMASRPHESASERPSPELCAAIESLRARSWFFEQSIPLGFAIERDWEQLPTMSREDLASRLVEVIPHDISDLDRMIVYDTSGSTGHAVHVPHDPLVLGKSHVLAERAMRAHGVEPAFVPGEVGCVNLCAQKSTYVFAALFAVWNGSGFVKVNLHEDDWAGGREAARTYLGKLSPQLLTSDPVSLGVGIDWQIGLRPRAVLSTAIALTPEARRRYEAYYGCPVFDWYSTTETGPIAYSAPDGDGWHLAAPDMFVELVDSSGAQVGEGERGEICVTSLRNPFLPLVRYRTGDYATLERGAEPRMRALEGRRPVSFRAANGATISSVDIGRAIRLVSAFTQHRFEQTEDRCTLTLRPLPGVAIDVDAVERALRDVLGSLTFEVRIDPTLGDSGKVAPYLSDL